MSNFTNIPFLNSIRKVEVTASPGINMDDDWNYNLIRDWQRKVYWRNKWCTGDVQIHVVHSTVAPQDEKIYNSSGVLVNTIPYSNVLTSASAGNWYLCEVQLDTDSDDQTLPLGVYFTLTQVTNSGSYNRSWISEPIEVRKSHINTVIMSYTNSENSIQEVPFGAYPFIFKIRIEAQLLEFQPESEIQDYVDMSHNAAIIDGVPYRTWKLKFANPPGLPDYMAHLINCFMCLDTVRYGITSGKPEGKLLTKVTNAKMEAQRAVGYPLAGWAILVTETITQFSHHYMDVDPVIPGFITAWSIDSDLYQGNSGNDILILDKTNT